MLRVIRHLHIDVSNDCLRRLWLGRVRILRTFGALRALRTRKRFGRREELLYSAPHSMIDPQPTNDDKHPLKSSYH